MSSNNILRMHQNNQSAELLAPQFLKSVITGLEKRLFNKLSDNEIRMVDNTIKSINSKILQDHTKEQVRMMLIIELEKKLKKQKREYHDGKLDVKEFQKNEIGVTSETIKQGGSVTNIVKEEIRQTTVASSVNITGIMGQNGLIGLQRFINPMAGYKRSYIIFDTRYRDLSQPLNLFSFNFTNSLTRSQGTVNSFYKIRDIIAFRVYDLRMPYLTLAETDHKRISLRINSFNNDAFLAQENRNFHCLFKAEVDGRFFNLTADNMNNGLFHLSEPITEINSFVLSFGNPLRVLNFDNDRSSTTVSSYGIILSLTTNISHNLENGDLVIISDFISLNSARHAAQSAIINDLGGNPVTIISPTQFSIDLDVSSFLQTGAGTVSVDIGINPVLVTGVGTAFTTFFIVGDYISINGDTQYRIISITSDTSLTVDTNISQTYVGQTYQRDNRVRTLNFITFFNSKRMFIPIEFTYISDQEDKK